MQTTVLIVIMHIYESAVRQQFLSLLSSIRLQAEKAQAEAERKEAREAMIGMQLVAARTLITEMDKTPHAQAIPIGNPPTSGISFQFASARAQSTEHCTCE